jgi:hypothetical protein
MIDIVLRYLDQLDHQRESAFAALDGLSEEQVWQRPTPKEWCLGEILDHNYLLFKRTLPYIKIAWGLQQRRAERRRDRPYEIEIEDPYRKESFPMGISFFWKPRYSPGHPLSLEKLMSESRDMHAQVRLFYTGKDPALLGNAFLYDPLFGLINLIITLRIGLFHDQLHYDDVFRRAADLKSG